MSESLYTRSGSLHIQRAAPSDSETLAAIALRSPSAPQWTAEQYAGVLLPKDDAALMRAVWLAVQDGTVTGFAVASALRAVYPAEAELESIAVVPEVRRNGVGRALLAAVTAWAVEQGADRLRLEVRTGNAEALGFYTALGFQSTGTRRAYYADPVEDAVCMCRLL